jgi:hypothetical protein
MHIHVFCARGGSFNAKSHDFARVHLRMSDASAEKEITVHDEATSEQAVAFLRENHANANVCMVMYAKKRTFTDEAVLNALDDIHANANTSECRVIFFTFDYWSRGDQPYERVMQRLFRARHHEVFTFAPSIEHLKHFSKADFSPFKARIVCNVNVWSAIARPRLRG